MQRQRMGMGLGWDVGHRKTRGRRAHKHYLFNSALGPQRLHGMAGDKGAERKPGQRQSALRRYLLHHGQQVLQLATAFVVHPFRGTHAAKVETHRLPAALHKGTRQGLHHFVVHGAAKQRVRMGDHHHTTRCHTRGQLGGIHHGFDAAGGAGHHSLLGFGVHVLLPI